MEKNLDSDALVDKKILAERGEGPAVISTAEVARRIVEIKRRAHASGLCHNTSDEIRRIGSQISQWEMTAYGVASEVIERARAEALTRSSQLIADAESHAAALTSDARKSAQLIVQDAHRRARVLRHGVREAPMEPAAENGVARFRRGERRTDTVRWPVARSASEGRTSIEVGGENKGLLEAPSIRMARENLETHRPQLWEYIREIMSSLDYDEVQAQLLLFEIFNIASDRISEYNGKGSIIGWVFLSIAQELIVDRKVAQNGASH